MQKVFSLAPNQVDVATNLPKTEIYVVRAVEFTPFKELWSDFARMTELVGLHALYTQWQLSERATGLIRMITQQQCEVSQAWLKKVKEDAGVQWEKQSAGERPAPGAGPLPLHRLMKK